MGKTYEGIEEHVRSFIERQHIFFVATAPSAPEGHVNLSPKGLDTLRILDAHRVAYLDLNGSGVETIAHLRDNGRIAIMFCAFEGPPKVVRLHGRGECIEPEDARFSALRSLFAAGRPARSVIVVQVERVSDSCGYGVPLYAYQGERSQLDDWAERKGPDGLTAYQHKHNALSIDGLPGLALTQGADSGQR